jgi:allantoinase
MSYPRDLRGYGRRPPHPRWPNGARIALQFVLNHEEGAENCVLGGDPASEIFLSEIIGAAAFPMRHMSMETLFEYGSRAGLWRVLRAFERRDLPLTIFGVARALERHPEAVAAYRDLGIDIRRILLALPLVPLPGADECLRLEDLRRATATVTGALAQLLGADSPEDPSK